METPIQKNIYERDDTEEYETYRAVEYSQNQIKEMEKSIINRSNNKNFGKRHKFAGGLTAKLEKKNIESFRGHENTIKEEPQNFSDDD